MTDQMLENLKRKLLSSRDRFILSNTDTLPDLEPTAAKKTDLSQMIKKSSVMNETQVKEKDAGSEPIVISG